MRLQVFLAQSGVASRRASADLIRDGHVAVNGKIVHEPGFHVQPESDRIAFRGQPIQFEKKEYFIFYKPTNVVTTASDEKGRKTVVDFFKKIKTRLYPVGRLDRNTTGILIMTNDGELANHLMHPRYGVVKKYVAVIDKPLSAEMMKKFKKGIYLESGITHAAHIHFIEEHSKGHAYEIHIHEGKNRQIRKMMEILEREVKFLHRFEYGPLNLGDLKPGEYRSITSEELKLLKKDTPQGSES